MPVTYHIDRINEIVFINAAGKFTAEDYRLHKRVRMAFLVPTEEVHGMVRMFSILSDFEPDVIQIFRDMAEARRWLGLDEATNSN